MVVLSSNNSYRITYLSAISRAIIARMKAIVKGILIETDVTNSQG